MTDRRPVVGTSSSIGAMPDRTVHSPYVSVLVPLGHLPPTDHTAATVHPNKKHLQITRSPAPPSASVASHGHARWDACTGTGTGAAHERTRVPCGSKGWPWSWGSRCMLAERPIDPAVPVSLPPLPLPPPAPLDAGRAWNAWTPGRAAACVRHRLRPTDMAGGDGGVSRSGRGRGSALSSPGAGEIYLGVHACTLTRTRPREAFWMQLFVTGVLLFVFVCWVLVSWTCVLVLGSIC